MCLIREAAFHHQIVCLGRSLESSDYTMKKRERGGKNSNYIQSVKCKKKSVCAEVIS